MTGQPDQTDQLDQPVPVSPWAARLLNIFSGLYLFLVGLSIALVLLVTGGPSFWFLPAAGIYALSGILWFRPRMAASFSLLFALLFLSGILTLKPWAWTDARPKGFAILLVLLFAVVLCASAIRRFGFEWRAFATAAVCILVCVAVDRAFTNKVTLRTLTMDYTLDGTTPWGDPAVPDPATNTFPVLIYTAVHGSYCYDTIFSEALKQHLQSLNKPTIHVEYNEFTNFGKPAGYNIHAVEGMVLNNGRRVIVPNKAGYGGTMMVPAMDNPKNFLPVVCPR